MERKQCVICGKVIEGFSSKHVKWLMLQHSLVHRQEEEEKEEWKEKNGVK